MPTTATQLDNHRSWATHYDKNPKWPSERKAEKEQQSRRSVLAQIKAARAERAAAAAAPSVYRNNVKVGQASFSDTDTASASSSRSLTSATRRSTPPSAPSSRSSPSGSSRELKAPRASTAQHKTANTYPAAALASSVLPIKPLPSSTPLESMFNDEKDLEHVHGSEEKRSSVETIDKASSSPSKKRKLPFGDDDSEGESDFEDLHRCKNSMTSTVGLDAEKHKHKKGAIKTVCRPQPRWQTLQSSGAALPRSAAQRAKIWRPSSNFRPVSSFFGSHGQTRALHGANQASLQPSAR